MTAPPSELRTAFVEAYPEYVASALHDLGIEIDVIIADAIVEGAAVLNALLESLERLPPVEQRHSPLELFREALRPIDHALDVEGLRPSVREIASLASWDRFGLAPGSSQVLGQRAHAAHLRWGVAKAAAVAPMVMRPRAAIITDDDTFEQLSSGVEAAGYAVGGGGGQSFAIALVDTAMPRAGETISREAALGTFVVAFGDEVDDLSTPGLKALGASTVVRTHDLLTNPSAYIPEIA
jgi:hypothetical protein